MTSTALSIVPHPNNRLSTLVHLMSGISSLGVMVIGGILVFGKMQDASQQIPTLAFRTSEQATDIAILREQQKNLDGKYAEIMLQLARLDAKLDKQNEYLFSSLQHTSHNQKDTN